ncbi:MAG: hypothetical protein IKQ49_05680 [Eubacterium sp.]|nr:hypothetical protein [Eubacterium sp.]
MGYTDEKDYIMRIIKEMVRVLFSVLLGKEYNAVELEKENKFTAAGKPLEDYESMADRGMINEAENELLTSLDYGNPEEVMTAAFFYEHVADMDDRFLEDHNYSREEAVEGMAQLARDADHGELVSFFMNV